METMSIDGVRFDGVCACLPASSVDNLSACRVLYGEDARAESVVKATGILSRRIAQEGTSSLDLCVHAAERLMSGLGVPPEDVGAVVSVSFTPERLMPGNAPQAQSRLGLSTGIPAFDLGCACSGYPYGLYLASLLASQLQRKVLLLDGDVQSAFVDSADQATVPVLADAGTATIVSPGETGAPWRFAFNTYGNLGDSLSLAHGGTISMDGYAVFKFVATEVTAFLKEFISSGPDADYSAFVPHQANVYMIRQLAKSLGFSPEKLKISADSCGNSASASVPVTLARSPVNGKVLLSGFGGGLSVSAADIRLDDTVMFDCFSC